MPRSYIKKKVKAYTSNDLLQAIEKVQNEEHTLYSASRKYNIPTTTLHDNLKKNTKKSVGRPTAIPLDQETQLAECIRTMEKWGFGLSRYEIMELVAEYVRVNNIRTQFNNNLPGTDWFINFRKRHRLSIKKAQPVEYVRKKMTDPFIIAEYFELLENTLKDLSLSESPNSIWNLDETSLCLDPSRTKVVGQINKPCSRITHGTGKENITVLTGASAGGKKLPPLIVYKGKYVWDQWMADIEDVNDLEISYAASNKGWMETEIFYNYMKKILIPNLGEERPVLIIFDGHSTHVDVRVVELAIQNNITILKLPPHTTHLLQPLDIAVFKSFKVKWDAKLVEWQRRNIGAKMPKKIFAQTLADTWKQINPDIIKTGFRKAGIYPYNPNVIPVDKYDPDAFKRFQKKISYKHLGYTQTNPKNPKLLKDICVDLFNKMLLPINNAVEKSTGDNVTTLSQISKSDIQTLSFVARHPSQIPICLKTNNSRPIQNQTNNSSKIQILSNIVIQQAPQPPLQAQLLPQQSCTFEELLLKKVQKENKVDISNKKKRVTKGAEVITATMGKKILQEMQKPKYTKQSKKIKESTLNKKDITNMQKEQPSVSGIKYSLKRKRQPSVDPDTSISDIMSEHSDIIDFTNFENLIDEFDDDYIIDKKDTKSQKPTKFTRKIEKKAKIGKDKIVNKKRKNCLSTNDKNLRKIAKENSEPKKNVLKVVKENKKKEVKRHVQGESDNKVTTRRVLKEKYKDEELLLDKDTVQDNEEENNEMQESYKLHDAVLVRYDSFKRCKYYIGFIEEIIKRKETLYHINFLKTTRQQQRLTFMKPKKKDTDQVPGSLIVKKMDIYRDNEKEYYLCNNEDTIYF